MNDKDEAIVPKCYTYVFGNKELLYKTPIDRFIFLKDKGISIENLKKAFSVEALSDEFFDKYREQYANFIQYITGKRFVKSGSKWKEKTSLRRTINSCKSLVTTRKRYATTSRR